jgi:EAL domain-containing protein (putative c-di-GMP-specific phosphodiesterase class I)
VKGQEIFVTASVGISMFPDDAGDAETLLQCADCAMYRAKHGGKNRFARYEPAVGAAQAERLAVENHLHRALEREEFAIHYQPQFDLKTGHLAGYEALLRWTHPKLGIVSPSRFVPIAEESGLITQIGSWALDQACRQARSWQRAGYPLNNIAVNVSAMQLECDDFVETVEHALLRSGLDPSSLELEITESMLMRDIEEFVQKLQLLRSIGVRISVDDFGTGYSSLSYLQKLPIDILKLDRSFIEGVNDPRHGASLVRAVVNMAHTLGLRVTAEGIETHHQLEVVQDSGCDVAQGYLLGRPKPAQSAVGIQIFPMPKAEIRRESAMSAGR